MKNSIILALLLLFTLSLTAGVTINYTLSTPELKTDGIYTKVNLENAQTWGNPGNPDLPWYGIKVLLPAGFEAEKIVVTRSNPVRYTLTNLIAPVQRQYPFSHTTIEPPNEPNADLYTSALPYPENSDNGLITEYLSGHPIAFSAISPFAYFPLKKELVFYRNLNVDISYGSSSKAMDAMRFLKNDSFTINRLQKIVDNPETVTMSPTREIGVEYLIVVDANKISQWTPLKALYEARGRNVLMKTMADIDAEYTGVDTQEKLRNYIISLFASNPLRYVLLAGDTDIIPHRGFYISMDSGGEGTDADIPADMYYSCLDGTWNDDGDGYWGEMYEADLVPELAIGRFCYNDDTEISNFINKVTNYLNNPVVGEVKSALFVGEWLWEGPTWGGDYMDEMIGGSSANNYTTVGVPTTWNISTLYDRTYGSSESWDANDLRPLLNQGPNLVNHLGHSNTTYVMRMNNGQVSASTITNNGVNHNFSTYFSQGCYAGAFDNRETSVGNYTSDCITEKLTSIATGPVAMIAHSRYGWGEQGSTNGASQYIHRQFIDAIFGENINEVGYALADSKIDNIPFISNTPVMYWVDYETNLLGDPAMLIWTDTPQTIVANLPEHFMVGVNNYQIQTNAPYAEFIIKNVGNVVYRTYADASGLIQINLLSSLVPGNYDIYFIAPNFYPYHTTIDATAAQMPYIVCNNFSFNDQDGLYETGETISMNIYIKNVGLLDLTSNGTLTLLCNSANIQILSPVINFSGISAGDSIAVNAAFQFNVTGNFNDQTNVSLQLRANYGTYTSSSITNIVLNAPVLQMASYQINNASSIIMPGDSPSISFSVANTGSGNAHNPMLLLFCSSSDIILNQYEVTLDPIYANTTLDYQSAITFQIQDSAQIDESYMIDYIFNAENGNVVEGNFLVHLGALSYGFESDYQDWETIALNSSFVNQWHRSSSRNHTPAGNYAMKFGGEGNSTYSGSAYGALISPVMNVSPNCQLKFYHWMNAEINSDNQSYAWDGGLVEMSLNGGGWTQITPVGGYPYRIYNNPASPFPVNTWVYSGAYDWTEATFELGNVNGTAQFIWIFGSDGYVGGEGWYVDDVRVVGLVNNADPTIPTVDCVILGNNYPNPFNPETTIEFTLPAKMPVCLEVYNIKGQLVNRLLNEVQTAGTHKVVFKGLDSNQQSIGSGVYYYQLKTPTGTIMRKMLLLK
ncbi:MAG: C25 family cysteine peptidase [Candidatus Cloacimonas sp.]